MMFYPLDLKKCGPASMSKVLSDQGPESLQADQSSHGV